MNNSSNYPLTFFLPREGNIFSFSVILSISGGGEGVLLPKEEIGTGDCDGYALEC